MKKRNTAAKPWYSEEAGFFGKGYLKEYVGVATDKKAKEDISFAANALNMKRGMKVLDLACGHGRHSLELARRGFEVTGFDLNHFFLIEAKKAAKQKGVVVRWVQGDMRVIPFEEEFDIVLNLMTSFGYLESDEEDAKVFGEVAKALKSKGKFLINVRSRDQFMKTFSPNDWAALPDGSFVLTERKFNTARGRNEEKRIRVWKNGTREEHMILCRMYTLPELIRMGKDAGLRFLKAYGDGEEQHTIDSRRMVLIFQKH